MAWSTVRAHLGRTVFRRGISTPRAGFAWRWPHFIADRRIALNTSWMWSIDFGAYPTFVRCVTYD